jgi:hypothetical protein
MNKLIKKNLCDLEIEFINKWAIIRQGDSNISLGNYPNKRWDIIIEALELAIKGAENKSKAKRDKEQGKKEVLEDVMEIIDECGGRKNTKISKNDIKSNTKK